MKYLVLMALFFVVLWGLRRSRVSHVRTKPPVAREPERMVTCSFCGVNQPLSESVLYRGRYFCGVAHRQEADHGTELQDD